VSLLRRDCNLVYSGGQSFSRDEATLSVPFEERFWKAITTCTKTVVDLDYVWAWDDAEIENLRPFNEIEPADYLVSALTAAARETRAGNARAHIYIIEVLSEYFDREDVTAALLALRDAGAAVLYLRRVSSPSPTYDLPADLHIIERYPLKNEYDDEVVLITEERVVVKAPIWGSRRPEWFKNPMDSKTMPTVAEYNTGRLDEFPVKLEAE
jgi:hypothetical protein